MTATVFRQSCMTQRPSLFTLLNYYAIVFSFALIFANGWFTACDGFYCASAYWLSHMKQKKHYHYRIRLVKYQPSNLALNTVKKNRSQPHAKGLEKHLKP